MAVNTFAGRRPGAVLQRATDFVWEFVFNMWERKASPVGTFHEVDLDVNGDGVIDFVVMNRDRRRV